MDLFVRINNDVSYPIVRMTDAIISNGREAKNIVLKMSHTEAENIFVDNVDMDLIRKYVIPKETITQIGTDENNEPIYSTSYEDEEVSEEVDLSDFCLAGNIVDYRDGTLSVYMSKISDKELLGVMGDKATSKKTLNQFLDCVDKAIEFIPDDRVDEFKMLFPDWKVDAAYETAQRIVYMGVVYKVLQTHISQENWTPDVAPSLFARVLTDEVSNEILEWVQPDSTNAYKTGDTVLYENQVWVSTCDNNVWAPGTFGWEVVAE